MENQAYEAVQIAENAWRIEENGVRSFLFAGSERALLVDTGFGTGDLRAVVEGLTDLPITLVNTHADRDHIGCNALFGAAHLHPAEYDRYFSALQSPLPVKALWEGDVIDIGGRRFEVVLIPGHTPGSIALLDEAGGVLIGGDSLQDGHIHMFGAGRNLPAYLASMEKLGRYRSRFSTVYPSHGSFPLSADILDGLTEGARRVLAGEIGGREAAFMGVQARVFDVGVAQFLCD